MAKPAGGIRHGELSAAHPGAGNEGGRGYLAGLANRSPLGREQYFDFSVRHFHEKLREEHAIAYSYSCIKWLLGWWKGRVIVVRTGAAGNGGRWSACCCTSTPASIAG